MYHPNTPTRPKMLPPLSVFHWNNISNRKVFYRRKKKHSYHCKTNTLLVMLRFKKKVLEK